MSSTSPRVVLAALCLLTAPALAACGGDDGPDPDEAAASLADGEIPAMQGEPCDVDVTLSGAVDQEWSGEGTVAVTEGDGGPPAAYQTQDGDVTLTAYSAGNGFDPGLLVNVPGTSYAVPTGDAGLGDIADDGSGATVEATAEDVAGDQTIEVAVSFDC